MSARVWYYLSAVVLGYVLSAAGWNPLMWQWWATALPMLVCVMGVRWGAHD